MDNLHNKITNTDNNIGANIINFIKSKLAIIVSFIPYTYIKNTYIKRTIRVT